MDRPGCYAQLQCVDARLVAHKPRSLDFAGAAALPLTTITAWEMLFDRLRIGDKVPEIRCSSSAARVALARLRSNSLDN